MAAASGSVLAAAPSRPIAIRNVTVIDATGAPAQPGRTVLIEGDRIASFDLPIPKNALVINGTGKFLIPGLWDMHVHLWHEQSQLAVYVAFGVTGVRDMGSNLARTLDRRAEIESGRALGPHVVTCGPAIGMEAADDEKMPVVRARRPEDARRIFDYLYDQNVDFLRILPSLPRDAYFALLEQGRHWNLPVAGGLPYSVPAEYAIGARQASIERLSGLFLACSSEGDKLWLAAEDAAESGNAGELARIHRRALATFSEEKARAVLAKIAMFEVRQVPELTSFARQAGRETDALACDARFRFVPAAIRSAWAETPQHGGASDYDAAAGLVRMMSEASVAVLAGTDTGEAGTIPGGTLHDELQELVRAGLTPLQALRSATIQPAKFLGWDEVLGTVEKDKIADLVLLDADPLANIANTQKIAAVFLRGRYIPRAAIARILAGAK